MTSVYSDPTAETSLVVGATSLSLATPPAGGAMRPVNSVLQIAGTDGAFLYPRLSTDELAALDNNFYTVTGGLQAYNNTTNVMNFYINGAPAFAPESSYAVGVATRDFAAGTFTGMSANPINLIAAPAPGFFLQVFNANIALNAVGPGYYTDGGDVRIQYGDTPNTGGVSALSADIPAATIIAAVPRKTCYFNYGNLRNIINQDITAQGIFVSNDGFGEFNGGANVTITITVYYKICQL